MHDIQAKLSSNLIGRLLGKDCICVQNDFLIALKNDISIASDSFRECKGFATLQNGIFGQVLVLSIGNKSVKYRFLQKSGSAEFLKVLNASIAEFINDYLSKTFNEFEAYVIREYPRDTRMGSISLLCKSLSEYYHAQADVWDMCLKSDLPPELDTTFS